MPIQSKACEARFYSILNRFLREKLILVNVAEIVQSVINLGAGFITNVLRRASLSLFTLHEIIVSDISRCSG